MPSGYSIYFASRIYTPATSSPKIQQDYLTHGAQNFASHLTNQNTVGTKYVLSILVNIVFVSITRVFIDLPSVFHTILE